MRTAVTEANRARGTRSWFHFVRRARPEIPVILVGDSRSLLGLTFDLVGIGLSELTGNGIFDGIATMFIATLSSGALLITAAVPEQVEAGRRSDSGGTGNFWGPRAAVFPGPDVTDLLVVGEGPTALALATIAYANVAGHPDHRVAAVAVDQQQLLLCGQRAGDGRGRL